MGLEHEPDLVKVLHRGWDGGMPYTKNGPGSLPSVTTKLAARLPAFLRKHGFTSVADLGCGDMSWASKVDWTGIEYTGYDYIVPVSPLLPFVQADIFKPQRHAQVALCRHTLIHFTNRQVDAVLAAINADYLLATNDYEVDNLHRHTDHVYPSFSRLNLETAPFFLTKIDAVSEVVPGQELALFKLR